MLKYFAKKSSPVTFFPVLTLNPHVQSVHLCAPSNFNTSMLNDCNVTVEFPILQTCLCFLLLQKHLKHREDLMLKTKNSFNFTSTPQLKDPNRFDKHAIENGKKCFLYIRSKTSDSLLVLGILTDGTITHAHICINRILCASTSFIIKKVLSKQSIEFSVVVVVTCSGINYDKNTANN